MLIITSTLILFAIIASLSVIILSLSVSWERIHDVIEMRNSIAREPRVIHFGLVRHCKHAVIPARAISKPASTARMRRTMARVSTYQPISYPLEHDDKKWEPVFVKQSCDRKRLMHDDKMGEPVFVKQSCDHTYLVRDDDSKKWHHALKLAA